MVHYDYKVKKVDRVGAGQYRLIVHVENLDNAAVAKVAWNEFASKYTEAGFFGKLKQAMHDLSSDKSEEIAGYITEASDSLYNSDKEGYLVEEDHIIDVVKNNNEWEPSVEGGIEAFVFDCAGIPILN